MYKIAVHSKTFEQPKSEVIKMVLDELSKRDVSLLISEYLHHFITQVGWEIGDYKVFSRTNDLAGADYFISIGGDGTFLESVTYVKDTNIPIAGINTGRLGFLATISKDKVKEALDAILKGYYSKERRSLIKVEAEDDIFDGLNFGLNEFTILKRDSSSMIVIHTYIDGVYLTSYWSDGLIIATPTGSTGYSLSVGGPVVIPTSSNFIISPVSPHNLSVRPLIVSDDSVISFAIEARSKNFLVSLDSRSRKVDVNMQLAVRKCDFEVSLIKLFEDNFLDTLRNKLNWGLDVRN
ncbi:NAD kinase [Flammeovirgaceae bacterium SG7u.111]|nr:NAD kinase [Flammeovirgaceae bacterium SG7u.132]WPO34146.1 NAD kinase [Flammeovirgaceae bacterium SG7u.111]